MCVCVCYLGSGDDGNSSYDFSLVGDLFHGPKYLLRGLCVAGVALTGLWHLKTERTN